MTRTIQLGTPPIDVALRRSDRAKRLSLRVSGLDGQVSLTVPRRVALREAHRFLAEKEDWIRGHLIARPARARIAPGISVPVEGVNRLIVVHDGVRVKMSDDQLHVPARGACVAPGVRAFLKTLARDRLVEASDRYAHAVGRNYARITLRDTRSRWGSCTSQGNLMYSWRLILAPPAVLDYVAAHEVAHLVHMNHSPDYWAGVAAILPGYKAPRKWLRENGAQLHRYEF